MVLYCCNSVSSEASGLPMYSPPLLMGEVACRKDESRQLKAGRVQLLATVFCYQISTPECKNRTISASSSKCSHGVIIITVSAVISSTQTNSYVREICVEGQTLRSAALPGPPLLCKLSM